MYFLMYDTTPTFLPSTTPLFSLNRPLCQFSLYVAMPSVVSSWKPCFLVNWRLLVRRSVVDIDSKEDKKMSELCNDFFGVSIYFKSNWIRLNRIWYKNCYFLTRLWCKIHTTHHVWYTLYTIYSIIWTPCTIQMAYLYNTHSIPCTVHASHLAQISFVGRLPEIYF